MFALIHNRFFTSSSFTDSSEKDKEGELLYVDQLKDAIKYTSDVLVQHNIISHHHPENIQMDGQSI